MAKSQNLIASAAVAATAAAEDGSSAGFRRHESTAQPRLLYPPYEATVERAPRQPLIFLPHTASELTGPVFGPSAVRKSDSDLTRQHASEPLGERIVVSGRVLDEDGRPVPRTLIELWQANAAGRYRHDRDSHRAPLDPNFTGAGRVLTGADGEYRFTTIKPGAYPWRNYGHAWRPAHVHFSLFGPAFVTRLVTQMYFPGDPLLAGDPILESIPNAKARALLIARFDPKMAKPAWALAYRFNIVLRGRDATPFERPK